MLSTALPTDAGWLIAMENALASAAVGLVALAGIHFFLYKMLY